MCGIAGLFLKSPALHPELGRLVAPMLVKLTDRGPDSAGLSLFEADGDGDRLKVTVRATAQAQWPTLEQALLSFEAAALRRIDTHGVITVPAADLARLDALLATLEPGIEVVARGRSMEIYKEVGLTQDVLDRFGLGKRAGSHAVGHTRMATESAVTTDGAHPFSTGLDQCLVHNGSLSNHNRLRGKLRAEGITIRTQNDSEVAAAYLTWRMAGGMSLGAALESALTDLDGFFTFVVATADGFGVVRDPIACKPAIMAETDDYVAFGSEYRALTTLPGIAEARLFEPEPARVYFWER